MQSKSKPYQHVQYDTANTKQYSTVYKQTLQIHLEAKVDTVVALRQAPLRHNVHVR